MKGKEDEERLEEMRREREDEEPSLKSSPGTGGVEGAAEDDRACHEAADSGRLQHRRTGMRERLPLWYREAWSFDRVATSCLRPDVPAPAS